MTLLPGGRPQGDLAAVPLYLFLHQPRVFSRRSGLQPLVESLKGTPVYYDITWERLQQKSWTLGHLLRRWGNTYYGSGWNALVPWWDERRFARIANEGVAHFLWGEFASPRRRGGWTTPFRSVVGTFHCSARRQPSVLGGFKCLRSYDWITVMSRTQIPFLVDAGFPAARIRTILHGVDAAFFRPPDSRAAPEGPIRCVLVGSTERDHAFMASVLRALPRGAVSLSVCTSAEYHGIYAGLDNVHLRDHLSDEDLRDLYGDADLMVMPLLDSTANNSILEAMACGTPVMVNRVGGVPEYVSDRAGWVMDGKVVGEWVGQIESLRDRRAELLARRASARTWAEAFGWDRVAPHYMQLYREASATGGRGGDP